METRAVLANTLKISGDRVYIIKMETLPGVNQTVGEAEIYDEAEKAKRIVPMHIQKRNMPEEKSDKVAPRGEGETQ